MLGLNPVMVNDPVPEHVTGSTFVKLMTRTGFTVTVIAARGPSQFVLGEI